MRLLFTSDLHGNEDAYRSFASHLGRDGYDCGLIAGDLMTHFSPSETDKLLQDRGLTQDDVLEELGDPDSEAPRIGPLDDLFAEALRNRAVELQSILLEPRVPVCFVMGNDDGIVAGGYEWPSRRWLVNANQRRLRLGEWNIVGYQFTNPFLGGLFEKPESEQENDLAQLRRLVDEKTILLTHGPPYGVLDGDNYGSRPLRDLVQSARPYLHLFGHIHQAAGIAWPFVNGAFPQLGRFLSIDVGLKAVRTVNP